MIITLITVEISCDTVSHNKCQKQSIVNTYRVIMNINMTD